MAAASLGSPWAWLRPTWRGAGTAALAGCLGTPGVPHFCLPSAGVAKLLPSPQSSSFPFLALPCLAEEAKSVTTELHPWLPALGQGQERGRGAAGQLGGLLSWKQAAFLEARCFLWRCGHGGGSYRRCFFYTPRLDARLVVECPEVCFLDAEMSLGQMLQYPE